MSNHNLIENKKTKRNKALQLAKEFKSKPRYKDKLGNNVKQHFGLYKYFINTTNQEKEKFYISQECRKVTAQESSRLMTLESQQVTQYGFHCYFERIKKVGLYL